MRDILSRGEMFYREVVEKPYCISVPADSPCREFRVLFLRSPEVSNGRQESGIPGIAWLRRPLGRQVWQSATGFRIHGRTQDPGDRHFHATPVAPRNAGISTCEAATPCGLLPRGCAGRIRGRSVPPLCGRPQSQLSASNPRHIHDLRHGDISRRPNRRRKTPSSGYALVQTKRNDANRFGLRIRGPLVGATQTVIRNRTSDALSVCANPFAGLCFLASARTSRQILAPFVCPLAASGNSRMDREGYLSYELDRD
jgi:hypothetical protein